MLPAFTVLLGMGMIALGILEPTMYVVGILVLLVGLVGVAVRGVDWLRWLLR